MQSCKLVPTLGVILNEMSTVLESLVYTRQNCYISYNNVLLFNHSNGHVNVFFGIESGDDQKTGTF
jgi:hypothetical protein